MHDLPSGWYADPMGPSGRLRYWDGFVWTAHAAVPTPADQLLGRLLLRPFDVTDVQRMGRVAAGTSAA